MRLTACVVRVVLGLLKNIDKLLILPTVINYTDYAAFIYPAFGLFILIYLFVCSINQRSLSLLAKIE